MPISTLEPQNILLANLYLIMLLQILLNWSASYCETNSNIMQLVFVLTLIARLFIQEFYYNKIYGTKIYKVLMMVSSLVILLGMGIFWAYTISTNAASFDNYSTNLACFQNRIMFVIEIIFGFLTLLKDCWLVLCLKES